LCFSKWEYNFGLKTSSEETIGKCCTYGRAERLALKEVLEKWCCFRKGNRPFYKNCSVILLEVSVIDQGRLYDNTNIVYDIEH
jgi:hypothetical protein